MRPKIALLTVLFVNAVAFGGYWVIKFITWEGMWLLHKFPGNHTCPKDDIPLSVLAFIFQILGLACAAGVLWLAKEAIVMVYNRIDKRFPEKKS